MSSAAGSASGGGPGTAPAPAPAVGAAALVPLSPSTVPIMVSVHFENAEHIILAEVLDAGDVFSEAIALCIAEFPTDGLTGFEVLRRKFSETFGSSLLPELQRDPDLLVWHALLPGSIPRRRISIYSWRAIVDIIRHYSLDGASPSQVPGHALQLNAVVSAAAHTLGRASGSGTSSALGTDRRDHQKTHRSRRCVVATQCGRRLLRR